MSASCCGQVRNVLAQGVKIVLQIRRPSEADAGLAGILDPAASFAFLAASLAAFDMVAVFDMFLLQDLGKNLVPRPTPRPSKSSIISPAAWDRRTGTGD